MPRALAGAVGAWERKAGRRKALPARMADDVHCCTELTLSSTAACGPRLERFKTAFTPHAAGHMQVWTADLDDSSSTMLRVAKYGLNPGSYVQYLPRPKAPPAVRRRSRAIQPAGAVASAATCGSGAAVAAATAQAAAGVARAAWCLPGGWLSALGYGGPLPRLPRPVELLPRCLPARAGSARPCAARLCLLPTLAVPDCCLTTRARVGPRRVPLAGLRCGRGTVGNGACAAPGACCSQWGHCGAAPLFCSLQAGCLGGPCRSYEGTPYGQVGGGGGEGL